jgi:hypothetical protein
MKKDHFKTPGCFCSVKKHSKKWMLLGLVFTLVFLGPIGSLQAEIYKWQDEAGTIHYSNTPPNDLTRILERYPTEKVPLVEDANGIVYYLNVPVGSTEMDIPEITVSPETLREIMKDVPADQVQAPAQPSPDMTTLTIRLAEVENALEREIGNRLKWEHGYARAQTLVKDLESQNKVLRLALTQMRNDLERVQEAVVVSDMQLTALKIPQHKQQLAMLEGKVGNLQSLLHTVNQQADHQVAVVQNEIETLKSAQGKELGALYAKLDVLESEIETINELALSEQLTDFSTKIHELGLQQQSDSETWEKLALLETEVKRLMDALPSSREASEAVTDLVENGNVLKSISEYQAQQINTQKDQIAALQTEIQQLKEQTVNAVSQQDDSSDSLIADLVEKNTFMEDVIKRQADMLNAQNEQIKMIEAKMAQLQVSSDQSVREQEVTVKVADNIEEELLTGGIRIIGRKERRRSRDILDLFRAPPFQQIEKK